MTRIKESYIKKIENTISSNIKVFWKHVKYISKSESLSHYNNSYSDDTEVINKFFCNHFEWTYTTADLNNAGIYVDLEINYTR